MHHISKVIYILCGIALTIAIPAGAWTAGIDITTGQATYDLQYGVEPNTTVEFDNGVDSSVPPPAPGMTKYANFVTTGTFRELSTDIRPEVNWRLYLMSDENMSITWDRPPVPLTLSLVTTDQSEPTVQKVPDMRSERNLALEPGTYIATISGATTSGGGDNSGDSDDSDTATYQPPHVETMPTPTPVDMSIPIAPSTNAVQTINLTNAMNTEPEDLPGRDINSSVLVAIPQKNTAKPTKSPMSATIPIFSMGLFLIYALKNNRLK